jgi:hypothetical protein
MLLEPFIQEQGKFLSIKQKQLPWLAYLIDELKIDL